MLQKSPFLTGFSTLLFGRKKRSMQEVVRKKRDQLRRLDGYELTDSDRSTHEESIIEQVEVSARQG